MKRIQFACLEQTIRFAAKDEISEKEAAELIQAEYHHFLRRMDECRTAYKVLSEDPQPDGSLVVTLKRQYNGYRTGTYLD